MRRERMRARGVYLVHLAGLGVLLLMASALAIDFGYYFAEQNRLQTAADASALAAISELYYSTAADPDDRREDATLAAEETVDRNQDGLKPDAGDVTFGFINPQTKRYDPDTFEMENPAQEYAMTAGHNAVRVTLRRTEASVNGSLATVVGRILGVHRMETGAYSVAMLDRSITSITNGGLRPIYACQGQIDYAMADGIPENNQVRIYGDRLEVDGISNLPNCPPPGSGNWGFADLRNCDSDVPGATDTAAWFNHGFPGTVRANRCYSTQSGNFITNHSVQNALDKLIAGRTVISIPVYNQYAGGGANTQVTISGFTGFVITGYQAQGSANQRHIRGYFTRRVCRNECTSGTSEEGTGGIMVRLRLAARS